MEKEPCASGMLEQNSNGNVQNTVKTTPGAIGYVGLAYVDGVKALKVDGKDCSVANVKDGSYPISRSLYMLTKGAPAGAAKEFIDFILSAEGQAIVEEEGFVKL
jgi:phosphate transport system substrate-binding protein